MSARAQALRAIRRVIGPEICDVARDAIPDARARATVTTRTHHLRHGLAAVLVLWLQAPDRCPACHGAHPDGHATRCHVRQLIAEMAR